MRVLVGCEESQAVCIAFRELGHEAYSCDLQECSGGHPEWHYQEDIFKVIENESWDMMIAFPPCTHLAVSGAAWFEQKRKDGRQQAAIDFFIRLANSPIDRIAIENPVGIMSKVYKKPTQIIQPYYFGDEVQKTTCLWLKNLPLLFHAAGPDLFNDTVTHVSKGNFKTSPSGRTYPEWCWNTGAGCGKERSKTFPGIAKAMSIQWGGIEINKHENNLIKFC